MQKYFPNFSDFFHSYYLTQQETFHSNEHGQIQFFLIILDLIIENFNELKFDEEFKVTNETFINVMTIFDSLYEDFCKHFEVTSLNVISFFY